VGILGQHPGDGQLRRAAALQGGQLLQRLHQTHVALAVLAAEARQHAAEVSLGGRLGATQEAAREDAVDGDADTEFEEAREDVHFRAPADEGVLNLQVHYGVHLLRAGHRVGAYLGQSDATHVTGLHHVGDGAHRVLDGDSRVEPGRAVDVHVVHPEAGEAVGEEILHRRRAGVEAQPAAVRGAQRAEFHRKQRLVPAFAQRPSDEELVVAGAVEVARVKQGDALVQGRVDGGDALRLVGRPVHPGHAHAPQGERKDGGAGGAELTWKGGSGSSHGLCLGLLVPLGN